MKDKLRLSSLLTIFFIIAFSQFTDLDAHAFNHVLHEPIGGEILRIIPLSQQEADQHPDSEWHHRYQAECVAFTLGECSKIHITKNVFLYDRRNMVLTHKSKRVVTDSRLRFSRDPDYPQIFLNLVNRYFQQIRSSLSKYPSSNESNPYAITNLFRVTSSVIDAGDVRNDLAEEENGFFGENGSPFLQGLVGLASLPLTITAAGVVTSLDVFLLPANLLRAHKISKRRLRTNHPVISNFMSYLMIMFNEKYKGKRFIESHEITKKIRSYAGETPFENRVYNQDKKLSQIRVKLEDLFQEIN